ncbi:UNKNOWN [Stylonychia lemnae]|uniref:Uncharacterized protein n=1 Tax=Stylonychia lemnae TaxID=5949 RepID=A0A078BB11_STYLE|nr:UNKNOWN [Stylonychia lemnae]|eukprot:CDW91584.1 UNKNOWN [Stylonychia lemnae]
MEQSENLFQSERISGLEKISSTQIPEKSSDFFSNLNLSIQQFFSKKETNTDSILKSSTLIQDFNSKLKNFNSILSPDSSTKNFKPQQRGVSKLILNQDNTFIGVIWDNQLGFSIFETTNYKLAYYQESQYEITHLSLLYRTLQYGFITSQRPNQVEFYDKGKKMYSQMFSTQIKDVQIVNRHYQAFALKNQMYIYKGRDLFDCIKTADNDKGLFSFATFKADDLRLILATISEKSQCSLQIKDFAFQREFMIDNVFGEKEDAQQNLIGDILLDDFGERLFVVNYQGILLKLYSIFELRTNQTTQPIQQFRRGYNACLQFGKLQILRIQLSKSEPDVEVGVIGGESGTIHFFRFKPLQTEIQDIDTIGQEEESKFSEFFRKMKDKCLPSLLTFESSQLKIRLDPDIIINKPYLLFPTQDSTLISKQKLEFQKDSQNEEGVLRMKFKIKNFTERGTFESNRESSFGLLNQSLQISPKDDVFDMYDSIDSPIHIKRPQPES